MSVRRRFGAAAALGAALGIGGVTLATASDTTFVGPPYPAAHAECTPAAISGHGLTPSQWQSVVGLPLTPAGEPARQRIVLGQLGQLADLEGVRTLLQTCGLPAASMRQVGTGTSDAGEATLDASVAASALPPRTDIVVASAPYTDRFAGVLEVSANACGIDTSGPTLTKNPATDANPYPPGGCIISVSYGSNETSYQLSDPDDVTATDALLSGLEDLGVIVVFSAGDESSGGCSTSIGISADAVGLTPKYPASNPAVLAVGGTQWDGQDRSMTEGRSIDYFPGDNYRNVVWKDKAYSSTCANSVVDGSAGGTGGGGGVSQYYGLPDYQAAAVTRTYPQQPGQRLVPDVAALAAWPMYAIIHRHDWAITGGTSAAAPSVAVGLANVNAVLTAQGLPPLDNGDGALDVHTVLYGSTYASAISDVTLGNNDLFGFDGSAQMPGYPPSAPAWKAEVGYDMASGLGVVNFATLARLLVSNLTPPTPEPSPTTTPTASPAPTASPSPTPPVTPTPTPTARPTAGPAAPPPNPAKPLVPASGVLVLGAAKADEVTPRAVVRDAGSIPGNAPRVGAKAREPIALIVPGLEPRRTYRVVLDSGALVELGTTTADGIGVARLPVFQLRKPGQYTLILRGPTGTPLRYVRLSVVA